MTKQIRIENADTSTHSVRVFVEDLQADGAWVRDEGVPLNTPTEMLSQHIHSRRRLVVEEVLPTEKK